MCVTAIKPAWRGWLWSTACIHRTDRCSADDVNYTVTSWWVVASHCAEISLCDRLFSLYYMCMHVVLLWHGVVSMVRLRPAWMTNHPPSVFWHCWLGHQTCKNIDSETTWTVLSGTLNRTQFNLSPDTLYACCLYLCDFSLYCMYISCPDENCVKGDEHN